MFEELQREKAGIIETPPVSDARVAIEEPIESTPIPIVNPEEELKQEDNLLKVVY